jgi:hypothetical protein
VARPGSGGFAGCYRFRQLIENLHSLSQSASLAECPLWVKSCHVQRKTHVRFTLKADIRPLLRPFLRPFL